MDHNYLIKNSIKEEVKSLNDLSVKIRDKFLENLHLGELEIIIFMSNIVGDQLFSDEFVKIDDITNKSNVEKIMVENRKKITKKFVKSYTKNVSIPMLCN